MIELTYDYSYFADQAEAEIRRAGHRVLPKPETDKPCLRDEDNRPIWWPGELLAEQGPTMVARWALALPAWVAYAKQQLGIAEMAHTLAEARAKIRKARVEFEAEGNATMRRMAAAADPEFIQLSEAAAQAKGLTKAYDMTARGYEVMSIAITNLIKINTAVARGERTGH